MALASASEARFLALSQRLQALVHPERLAYLEGEIAAIQKAIEEDPAQLEICKFVPGSYGTNGCPPGLQELTLEECQASPESFAGQLHEPFVLESSYFPKGCFQCAADAGCQGNPIYFNSHPGGSEFPGRRPLCKSCEAGAPEKRVEASASADDSDGREEGQASKSVAAEGGSKVDDGSSKVSHAMPQLGRPWTETVRGDPDGVERDAGYKANASSRGECVDADDEFAKAMQKFGQDFHECQDAKSLCVESLVSSEIQLHCPASCGLCEPEGREGRGSEASMVDSSTTASGTSTTLKATLTRTTVSSTTPIKTSRTTTTRHSGSKRSLEHAPSAKRNASGDDPCVIEVNTDYMRDDLGPGIPGITSAELCRTICQVNANCGAWTWGQQRKSPGLTDVCFLKKQPKASGFKKTKKTGVVSGLPCPVSWDSAPSNTMYCWALTQPDGYEPKLLEKQYKAGVSLFACDEYALYSNKEFSIGAAITSVVHHNITAVYGGEFYTALNTKIFAAVWTKVIQEGRFEYHTWTVKVDPDTVFLPDRLKGILEQYSERPHGIYLNNCQYGLHGPVEVFSKNAVRAWGAGSKRCFTKLYEGCKGECAWGEDLFIDQCLWKVLSVEREDNFDILQEDHCDPPDGWTSCEDPTKASFHPFKTEKDWFKCLKAAQRVDAKGAMGTTEVRVKMLQ